MTEQLKINALYKQFSIDKERRRQSVLENINLTIDKGEFITIVGHSGCGKSTLLKIIAGLELPDSGSCLFNGNPIRGISVDIGIVFQEHRLFPWLTIDKNIKLGLERFNREEQEKQTNIYLEMVKLSKYKYAYPSQLSGGMSQRAAIARALAPCPEIILLDEPFSSLDAFTKVELQEEIKRIHEKQKNTVIMVTHDIEEAVFLADRIVIMSSNPGTIQHVYNINLGQMRDRAGAEFTYYKKVIYDYFFQKTG